MNRIWTGVVAGVLAASLLLTVGIGAYRAGQDGEIVTRTVSDGEVVRVVDGQHWGPGPGFFLFPLLIILLIVFLVRGRRWGHGGWYGRGGPGYCGPPAGSREDLDEWHRQAHDQGRAAPTPEDAPPRDFTGG
jgi:hypothetical protein